MAPCIKGALRMFTFLNRVDFPTLTNQIILCKDQTQRRENFSLFSTMP